MILDEMGRKSLITYFKKNNSEEGVKEDAKILSVIEMYLYMCRVRREKGEKDSEEIIKNIKDNILEIQDKLPENIQNKNL